jgi:hypothetical protein
MWYWPSLKLTDYEKQYVQMYKTPNGKPGVLRRVYRLQLATQIDQANNIPAVQTIAKIQIGRRSRIFGITFTGSLDGWRLSIKNSNGTLYTNPTPRTNLFPIVSSIIAGSQNNALAMGSAITPYILTPGPVPQTQSFGAAGEFNNLTVQTRQNFPWLIEPNWVCQPNETIIFEGFDASPTYGIIGEGTTTFKLNQILNIAFYAWEFPGMGK